MDNRIQGNMPTSMPLPTMDTTIDTQTYQATMYQYLGMMAQQVNSREIGMFDPTQINVNGQQYFPNRENPQDYRGGLRRFIYYDQPLPAAGSVSIPHNIPVTATTTFTGIRGVTNIPGSSGLPLPFASPTTANNISLEVTATDVILTVGTNRSAYTRTYIIIDFIID